MDQEITSDFRPGIGAQACAAALLRGCAAQALKKMSAQLRCAAQAFLKTSAQLRCAAQAFLEMSAQLRCAGAAQSSAALRGPARVFSDI